MTAEARADAHCTRALSKLAVLAARSAAKALQQARENAAKAGTGKTG